MAGSRIIEVSSQGVAEVRRTEAALIYEAGGKIMELSRSKVYYIEDSGRMIDTQTGAIVAHPGDSASIPPQED